ncbi:uncharacterized protein V6R79_003749 [Siganus canaliculatus]
MWAGKKWERAVKNSWHHGLLVKTDSCASDKKDGQSQKILLQSAFIGAATGSVTRRRFMPFVACNRYMYPIYDQFILMIDNRLLINFIQSLSLQLLSYYRSGY